MYAFSPSPSQIQAPITIDSAVGNKTKIGHIPRTFFVLITFFQVLRDGQNTKAVCLKDSNELSKSWLSAKWHWAECLFTEEIMISMFFARGYFLNFQTSRKISQKHSTHTHVARQTSHRCWGKAELYNNYFVCIVTRVFSLVVDRSLVTKN